jgi:hypothetical protein
LTEGQEKESIIINRPAIPDIASVSRMILTDSALLVRKTPPEVAATGHDRCIIVIKPENVKDWLAPDGLGAARLDDILRDRLGSGVRASDCGMSRSASQIDKELAEAIRFRKLTMQQAARQFSRTPAQIGVYSIGIARIPTSI